MIIQNKGKREEYYPIFDEWLNKKKSKKFTDYLYLALSESFHKRLAYLRSNEIVKLSQYAKDHHINAVVMTTAAKRQTIPAFRQEGLWRIAKDFVRKGDSSQ